MIDSVQEVSNEKAFLVGLYSSADVLEPDLSLDELASLVSAAGGEVIGRTYQRLRDGSGANPATFIGKGKAEQVASFVEDLGATIVVFDNELSPAQIRELEKLAGCKVIDRSELILDIFAGRARTKEAKLQVELAQLEYTAPRLRGMWTHLERQAGTGASGIGMGMKGPGEKQIEIDRRIVRDRIAKLRAELRRIHARKEREVRGRTARAFTVGLVGYTNAGKSTLMNALTDANTYQADQLFATLDTKTRRWQLAPGTDVALSDTVGFVRRLPHHLVASFRSTLEEALHADLLLHVIDASHPQTLDQVQAVENVLGELDCEMGRVVAVFNKVDKIEDPEVLTLLRARLGDSVTISARDGTGLDELADLVAKRRQSDWVRIRIISSAGDGKLQAAAKHYGSVVRENWNDAQWTAEVEVAKADLPQLERIASEATITPLG